MIAFLAKWIGIIVGAMVAILPASPFVGLVLSGQAAMAIGWLNWIIPVGDMLNLMILWAGALLAVSLWHVVKDSINRVTKIVTK